jgi:acyl-CoA thioester hydrolase
VSRALPSTRDAFADRTFELTTRWMDNDVYGHVNNVVYYAFFDTVINRVLIENGLDIKDGTIIGLAVETGCRFHASFAYPEMVEAKLRVAHLGSSSVRYEIGLFGRDADGAPEEACRAEGHFVHVFVDRVSRRPQPIPERLRQALAALQVSP